MTPQPLNSNQRGSPIHKHKWALRDDGNFECVCGCIFSSSDIRLFKNYPKDIDLQNFWQLVEKLRWKTIRRVVRLPYTVYRDGYFLIGDLRIPWQHMRGGRMVEMKKNGVTLRDRVRVTWRYIN